MNRRRGCRAALELVLVAALFGCDDTSDEVPVADSLCPTIQAWSDATVDAVDNFRIASRELDTGARRARYGQAFDELAALHERLAVALGEGDIPDGVVTRLDEALAAVEDTVAAGAAAAEDLPESAYEFRAVRDGTLVTGVEKAKAIVFNTLAELATDPDSEIPRGCGRRGALDLSPSATFPP